MNQFRGCPVGKYVTNLCSTRANQGSNSRSLGFGDMDGWTARLIEVEPYYALKSSGSALDGPEVVNAGISSGQSIPSIKHACDEGDGCSRKAMAQDSMIGI
jgi:hypothetical protein